VYTGLKLNKETCCDSLDRSVGKMTGFNSRHGQEIFLYSAAFVQALETTQRPIQWVNWVLYSGIKRQGREAGHSAPSTDVIKDG
jgi:hypothetical protein